MARRYDAVIGESKSIILNSRRASKTFRRGHGGDIVAVPQRSYLRASMRAARRARLNVSASSLMGVDRKGSLLSSTLADTALVQPAGDGPALLAQGRTKRIGRYSFQGADVAVKELSLDFKDADSIGEGISLRFSFPAVCLVFAGAP